MFLLKKVFFSVLCLGYWVHGMISAPMYSNKHYKDPNEFRPERWLEEDTK